MPIERLGIAEIAALEEFLPSEDHGISRSSADRGSAERGVFLRETREWPLGIRRGIHW